MASLFKAKRSLTFLSHRPVSLSKDQKRPLFLAVFAAWELRILSQDSSLLEVITLGCFLIATMASLRFRDLLRTKPESLTIQRHILRGISWRAKTSVSGQPWGVCCLGFTTRPCTGHSVFRFLEALQLGIDKSRENWGTNWTPDFLLPSWTDSVPFSAPCSYHHALALIRFYSQCCWLSLALLSPEQAANLSTHSMKSTLPGFGICSQIWKAMGQPKKNTKVTLHYGTGVALTLRCSCGSTQLSVNATPEP